ncbi:arginase family protein [Kribbella capetownensis]|uniref:arginase family protein n=1 Tax=Kribbella capetownensis TaxID=1572659 RepID=UPI001EE141CD|nr:arginase family protein [Kribbella capetownensis]
MYSGDHSIAFPDAKRVANVLGHGRVSMLHFDAHADTGNIEFGSLWGAGESRGARGGVRDRPQAPGRARWHAVGSCPPAAE